jgi:hypothetical protein
MLRARPQLLSPEVLVSLFYFLEFAVCKWGADVKYFLQDRDKKGVSI